MLKRKHTIQGSAGLIVIFIIMALCLSSSIVMGLLLFKKHYKSDVAAETKNTESQGLYLEYSSMIDELKSQKNKILQREEQLNRQSIRIRKLENELTIARQRLENLHEETAVNITMLEKNEEKNLRKLAKLYSNMDPTQAAPILAGLDDDIIANILVRMKERQAARLLGSFAVENANSKDRAALISKKIRKMN